MCWAAFSISSACSKASSVRAWPKLSSPDSTRACTVDGSRSRRRKLATVVRSLPVRCGHLLLGHVELAGEPLEGAGLLHGVEVGALQIFDDGDLHRLLVRDLAQDGGDGGLAGQLRGAPAALAGDELEAAVGQRPHQDRLHDSVGGDGGSQLGQLLFVQLRSGSGRDCGRSDRGESRGACRLRFGVGGGSGRLAREGEANPGPCRGRGVWGR